MPADGLLDGLVVVEHSNAPAARFCGWLFAQNGATVYADEPAGDPAIDAFLDARKRRGTPDRHPDVVIADEHYAWDRLAASTIGGTIVEPGTGTPAGSAPSEAVLAAASGAAGFTLELDGRPVVVGGHRYQYLAGAYLYAGLTALLAADNSRPAAAPDVPAPDVTVDLLQAVVATLPYPTTQYEYNGSTDTQQQSGPRFVLPCRDGWVAVYAGSRWPGLAALLDEHLDDTDRVRFESVNERFRDLVGYNAIVAAWAAGRTVAAAVADGVSHSVAVAAVRTLDEVLDDPDLNAEGAWEQVESSSGTRVRVPTLAYRVDSSHTAPGTTGAANPRRLLDSRRAATVAGLPLAGRRVLDLTHIWSGPLATRLLAGLGAEVVRIENPSRPDSLRGKPGDIESRYPANGLGDDYVNRNAWFNTHNTDKLSVLLDLKIAADRERFLALVADSDLVIANYRPGVLDRLGVGLEALRSVNPEIVLVEMPGHFSISRHAQAAVYGAQMEAASGAAYVLGGSGRPVLTGYAFGDPAGGLTAAAAAVTALAGRARTGRAAAVEISQSHSMLAVIGEEFARWQLDGAFSRPTAAQYRAAAGPWVVVDGAPDQVRAAAATIAEADESTLGAAVDELCRAGLAAAVVCDGAELLDDPHLCAGEFFHVLDHAACGRHRYPGLPLTVGGRTTGAWWPAPLLGEHQPLLEEWLQQSTARGDDDVSVI